MGVNNPAVAAPDMVDIDAESVLPTMLPGMTAVSKKPGGLVKVNINTSGLGMQSQSETSDKAAGQKQTVKQLQVLSSLF